MKIGGEVFVRRKSDGKYLILQSGEWPEHPDRSHKLDIPGGYVEANETPLLGALRELSEETGMNVDETQALKIHSQKINSFFGGEVTLYFYLVEVFDADVILSWEHEKYYWFNLEQMRTITIREPFKSIITKLIEQRVLA